MVCYGGGRTGRKLARIFRKQPSHSSSPESTEIRISFQGQCSILSRSQVRDWYISTSSLCKFVAVVVTQANFSWGHNMKLVKVIVTFTLELIYFFAQSNIENLRISIVCPLACFLAVIFCQDYHCFLFVLVTFFVLLFKKMFHAMIIFLSFTIQFLTTSWSQQFF